MPATSFGRGIVLVYGGYAIVVKTRLYADGTQGIELKRESICAPDVMGQ
jgi:hypothetical protein